MGLDVPPGSREYYGGERRSAARYVLQLPVVVQSNREPSEIHAVTRDVSARGIYFVAREWPLLSRKIEFKMIFPAQLTRTDTLRAKCRGRVLRVEIASNGSVGIAATIDTFTIA
jgi:hypothetical protein